MLKDFERRVYPRPSPHSRGESMREAVTGHADAAIPDQAVLQAGALGADAEHVDGDAVDVALAGLAEVDVAVLQGAGGLGGLDALERRVGGPARPVQTRRRHCDVLVQVERLRVAVDLLPGAWLRFLQPPQEPHHHERQLRVEERLALEVVHHVHSRRVLAHDGASRVRVRRHEDQGRAPVACDLLLRSYFRGEMDRRPPEVHASISQQNVLRHPGQIGGRHVPLGCAGSGAGHDLGLESHGERRCGPRFVADNVRAGQGVEGGVGVGVGGLGRVEGFFPFGVVLLVGIVDVSLDAARIVCSRRSRLEQRAGLIDLGHLAGDEGPRRLRGRAERRGNCVVGNHGSDLDPHFQRHRHQRRASDGAPVGRRGREPEYRTSA